MLQEINLFNEEDIGLKKTKHFIPSYKNLVGTKHGKLYIDSLCRKKNRNMLKCICQCGRVEYLYRWQLKYRDACSVCKPAEYKDDNINKQLFQQLKINANNLNVKFQISYEYANFVFHKQNRRCAFSKVLLQHCKDMVLNLIEPNKGYVKGNIQWIAKNVADMKNSLNDHDFVKLCKKITRLYKPIKFEKEIENNIL